MTTDRNSAEMTLERAETLLGSDPSASAEALRSLLEKDPLNARAYRLLGRALATEGRSGGVVSSTGDPLLVQAAQALQSGNLERAEIILRPKLRSRPTDVTALHMLGELAVRLDYEAEAEDLYRLALEYDPDAPQVKFSLAALLHRKNRAEEAIGLLDDVLGAFPQQLAARNLQAAAYARAGRPDMAEQAYRESLRRNPQQPKTWAHYGNLLKTIGRRDDCLAALKTAVEMDPAVGDGWWSLADLKTFRFEAQHIRKMEDAIDRPSLAPDDRIQIEFALGRAFEQTGNAAAAFQHYATGNSACRAGAEYDPTRLTAYVDAAMRVVSPEFIASRAGDGCDAPDPIFIVGMTRSGSTLIEQILASHPQVEGTFELHAMPEIANRLAPELPDYAAAIEQLGAGQLSAIGEDYMERTRANRKTDRPFFVDKMPINWLHVPLIHLALPNAKIIDARRHPLDCCVSNFKELYRNGLMHTYDLGDLGRYYVNYVCFMAHIDRVLPGKVHRVIHEKLVVEPESEIRSLLDRLDLPFDEACLRFWETDRAVRTPSAEQVRQPINARGLGSWRKFEPWLDPLKTALGPVLASYPDVPDFGKA